MSEQAARFYRYRYLNYWEAEVPMAWSLLESAPSVSFSARKHGETVFSVFTVKKDHWDSILSDMSGALFKPMLNWEEATEKCRPLDDSGTDRTPEVDHVWDNPMDRGKYRQRVWSFRSAELLVYVEHCVRSENFNEHEAAIVDRFVNTLSILKV